MMPPSTPSTYVFDAYGTLFDVHSAVRRHREAVGPQAERISELWRLKQLEYTWVRSLMGAYEDFEQCTEKALDYAASIAGVRLASGLRADLLAAYDALSAFPEVKDVLGALKAGGARLAVLSNGTPAMLAKAVASAGLKPLIDDIVSVDELRVFKTDARVYARAGVGLQVKPPEVSFQSSNRWDIAGAKKFGFWTVWINRAGLPDEYADLPADRVVSSLEGLL